MKTLTYEKKKTFPPSPVQTLYCVSVPCETPWVREEHRRRAEEAGTLGQPQPGTSGAGRRKNNRKRNRDGEEEEEDAEMGNAGGEGGGPAANGRKEEENGEVEEKDEEEEAMETEAEEARKWDNKKARTDDGAAVNSGTKPSSSSPSHGGELVDLPDFFVFLRASGV